MTGTRARKGLAVAGGAAIGLFGLWLAYAVGAGYLPALVVPTPWNAGVAAGLAAATLALVRLWPRDLLRR